MNPLFQKFARYVRNRALAEFRNSTVGSIVNEIDRLSKSRSGNSSRLTRLTRELINSANAGGLSKSIRRSEIGKFSATVQKYASGSAKDALLETMFQGLGPLGEVFRTFLRTRIQANMPPSGPLSTTGPGAPISSSRFKMPDDAAEAQQLLESLGFTVTPPNKKPPRDVEYITTQAGDRVGLRVRGKALPYAVDDPILTGEMIRVNSSNVYAIGFIYDHDDPTKSVLKVRFLQSSRNDKDKKVAGPMYFYYRVPPAVFENFRIAASKGKFVWDRLRIRGTVTGHQFQYDLKGIAEGYVPRKATRYGSNEYFIKRGVNVRSVQGRPLGRRESELPDQFVQSLDPSRGRRPVRATGRKLGPGKMGN